MIFEKKKKKKGGGGGGEWTEKTEISKVEILATTEAQKAIFWHTLGFMRRKIWKVRISIRGDYTVCASPVPQRGAVCTECLTFVQRYAATLMAGFSTE